MSLYLLNEFSDIEDSDRGITSEDVELAKKNALEGDKDAIYHLGLMFDTGRGVARNPREAANLYKKASEMGHGAATYFLAKMYNTDTSGIPRNDELAQKLFIKATELGYTPKTNQQITN